MVIKGTFFACFGFELIGHFLALHAKEGAFFGFEMRGDARQ